MPDAASVTLAVRRVLVRSGIACRQALKGFVGELAGHQFLGPSPRHRVRRAEDWAAAIGLDPTSRGRCTYRALGRSELGGCYLTGERTITTPVEMHAVHCVFGLQIPHRRQIAIGV